jgi:hypothetical protein
LTDLEEITPFTSTPKPEQLRRSFIEQINISLRLLINGREVLKTNGRPLTMENFTVDFVDEYEDFIVQTVDPPKSILVEVYEKVCIFF